MNQARNKTMEIFSVMLIIMVVLGHTAGGTLDLFNNWFPIASFHMPAFVFVSGYFYKNENADRIFVKTDNYLIKKIKHLLLPYFIWNLFYGIFVNIVKSYGVIGFGANISFSSLLFEPWISGHQFGFNCAAWFVPQLFIIQILYVFLQRFLGINKKKVRLILFTLIVLIAGAICIFYSIKIRGGIELQGFQWLYLRTGFLLPFYHFGYLYRNFGESKVKNRIGTMLLFCFSLQFVILCVKGWDAINFSAVSCVFNTNIPLLPYIAAFNGILFWMLAANILTPAFQNSRVIAFISKNTWSIMMHHITAFFIVNIIWILLYQMGWKIPFDTQQFFYNQYYMCLPNEYMKVVYAAFGIIVPLAGKYGYDKLRLKVGM